MRLLPTHRRPKAPRAGDAGSTGMGTRAAGSTLPRSSVTSCWETGSVGDSESEQRAVVPGAVRASLLILCTSWASCGACSCSCGKGHWVSGGAPGGVGRPARRGGLPGWPTPRLTGACQASALVRCAAARVRS